MTDRKIFSRTILRQFRLTPKALALLRRIANRGISQNAALEIIIRQSAERFGITDKPVSFFVGKQKLVS